MAHTLLLVYAPPAPIGRCLPATLSIPFGDSRASEPPPYLRQRRRGPRSLSRQPLRATAPLRLHHPTQNSAPQGHNIVAGGNAPGKLGQIDPTLKGSHKTCPAGAAYGSRGQRPRNAGKKTPDPEGVP